MEVPQRTSAATLKTAQKLRTPGSDGDSVSSPNPANRTPKDRSPKVVCRRSPRSPVIEVLELCYVFRCASHLFLFLIIRSFRS